ncbi:MAG: prolyl oligopeptidase family serine peptidase [Muribaculaceae bacterium]|nr:prolyl oligopeptidase family serine peptidase [Muribaculaceae bacterium]
MFGSADDNVHIVNSMQYVSKLVDMNRTCDMMVFPNMNHSIRDCSARYVVYKRALEFYDQYLK